MKTLEVKNLVKNYKEINAVKNVNFEIEQGEIFALVGPNGAGKSTVLKIVATILAPTNGEIFINNKNIANNSDKIRETISYLPEEAGAYKNLNGHNYLKFMAAIYTDDNSKQKEYLKFAEEVCGLGARLKDKIKTYSKGMTRKLLLARTVMSKPKLTILDEPTSGLDVINAVEIRNTIKKLANEGMSVLLSSHNMLEIEYLSHRVALINKGEIKAIGTPQELKTQNHAQNLEEVFVKIAL
ncbi:MAG TPA: ABC transporter ATP-binding protein [Candidatus Portnoybacteria bacterium]|jgi:ABC-2 type transport system ATP-binding protein|nr:ABC transporter ATP-binding protein [Candidatus Portnoybacteria bacterium]MDD5752240.1 ABC transporter ATP-binding protein [Candidatus Portnoybacteria bacterium]HNU96822.1 ABC transporter ATP-binding protein [Candidatus Portnoybacteria bacterium]HOZ16504.1 ABC transporter ATP-binding protein [Candidatus Portnoybacteria bacterium]HPH52264.1 ABC transporter ATP-binding protein [Candidatus Portnoybacteria bacterium]